MVWLAPHKDMPGFTMKRRSPPRESRPLHLPSPQARGAVPRLPSTPHLQPTRTVPILQDPVLQAGIAPAKLCQAGHTLNE